MPHNLADVIAALARIEAKVDVLAATVTRQGRSIMADLTNLTAAVTAETTVASSVLTLLNGIISQLQAANGNQAAIDALTVQLQASAQAMTAAVTANTPAAPSSPAAPAPTTPSA